MNNGISLNPAAAREEQKALIRQLLSQHDLETIASWAAEHKFVERLLNSLVFESEDLVCWRAIETIGRIAALKATTNLEGVRERIRRLLWVMNDESGNSSRHAPKVVGEILASVPVLVPEFAHLLPSFCVPSLHEHGLYWAMARIASVVPAAFVEFSDMLIRSLSSPDAEIRGLALRALSPQARKTEAPLIRSLQNDNSDLHYYDPVLGSYCHTTVGEIARQGVARS